MITITLKSFVVANIGHAGTMWFIAHFPSGVVEFTSARELLLYGCAHEGQSFVCEWMRACKLSWDLQCAELSERDLSGANLTGANLRGANLREADLKGANLRGVDLSGADLRYTDLRSADLRGADLCGTKVCGGDMQGADLTGSYRLETDSPIPDWVAVEGKLVRR